MSRQLICVLIAWCGLTASDAAAQLPYQQSRSFSSYGRPGGIGPTSRPTFSPYLNLLRGGNSTLFNYYGLVRPEMEFRAANQQFQSSFGRVDQQLRDVQQSAGSRLSQSGHQVRFMSDLRGPTGSLINSDRLPASSHSRLGVSGHAAWFGNTGVWYQPFGSQAGVPSRPVNQGLPAAANSGTGSFGPPGPPAIGGTSPPAAPPPITPGFRR